MCLPDSCLYFCFSSLPVSLIWELRAVNFLFLDSFVVCCRFLHVLFSSYSILGLFFPCLVSVLRIGIWEVSCERRKNTLGQLTPDTWDWTPENSVSKLSIIFFLLLKIDFFLIVICFDYSSLSATPPGTSPPLLPFGSTPDLLIIRK